MRSALVSINTLLMSATRHAHLLESCGIVLYRLLVLSEGEGAFRELELLLDSWGRCCCRGLFCGIQDCQCGLGLSLLTECSC